MPQLLIFAPCEKLIIGQGDYSVSLIGILQNVQISLAAEEPSKLPDNAAVPMSWVIFGMWRKQEGDEGNTYEQRVALVSPTGKTLVESATRFVME